MTQISEIHGLPKMAPATEYADRGKEVQRVGYLPYLSMTQGEFRLALLRQQAETLARFYPDMPAYRAAAQMVDAALKAGVHNGISWIGRIDDNLQDVARQIARAESMTAPAAGSLYARPSLISGIGEIIPATERLKQCIKAAGASPGKIAKCQAAFNIEQILNNGLEGAAHHTLYFKIPESYPIPDRAYAKWLYHTAGIEGLAVVADISKTLMGDWVDTAIQMRNANGGVGPIYSEQTSFYLAPDPDQAWANYKANKPYVNPKQDKMGIVPALIIAIAGLISAALGGAVSLLEQMRKNKAYAMSEAKGYGTNAFSASKTDWEGNATDGSKNNGLLLAAAAGALLLMSDENT